MDYYCSKCKESISVDEYDYSIDNFDTPLCRKHQRDFSEKDDIGLSEKENASKKI